MHPSGIAGPEHRQQPVTAKMRPDAHSRVCWAAAIGVACHEGQPLGVNAAMWALRYLAEGGQCLCGSRARRRHG
ncbi:MAG: hypothetical protein M3Z00_11770 [Actinomycetota bacterium]|nr:hypothetical protein [Actinomycetota bacterium]